MKQHSSSSASRASVQRKPAPTHRAGTAAHEIRIIGGQWKRTKLKVADKPGLRPTPDRVRETVFNWVGSRLQGARCLDAFAGTGALGFEAASRGAFEVVLVEQDSALLAQLQTVRTHLLALQPLDPSEVPQILVQRGDGVAALRQAKQSFDLIFLDPPFDAELYESALKGCTQALKTDGLVYMEAPTAWTDAQLLPLGWKLSRYLKAGAVHAHLLEPCLPQVPAHA